MRTSGFFDFGLSVPQLLDVWVCMWRIRTGISQYGTVSDYMFRSSANSAAIAEQRGHTWLACSSRGDAEASSSAGPTNRPLSGPERSRPLTARLARRGGREQALQPKASGVA